MEIVRQAFVNHGMLMCVVFIAIYIAYVLGIAKALVTFDLFSLYLFQGFIVNYLKIVF